MRDFVSHWARRHGIAGPATFSACLVATEAVTNAMRHAGARPEGSDRPITVTCALCDDDVLVAVTDRGRFSSRRDRRGEHGGRGLAIIAQMTSAFELEARPEGTRLEMRVPTGPGVTRRTPGS